MSARDFRAAGLDKLSAEELANLNRWLNGEEVRMLGSQPASGDGAAGDRSGPGFERGLFDEGNGPDEVVSRISGSFDGWSGKTVFRLENGQVWKQVESGRFSPRGPMSNPKVTIDRGFLGAWRLKVEGYNSFVKVERVE